MGGDTRRERTIVVVMAKAFILEMIIHSQVVDEKIIVSVDNISCFLCHGDGERVIGDDVD